MVSTVVFSLFLQIFIMISDSFTQDKTTNQPTRQENNSSECLLIADSVLDTILSAPCVQTLCILTTALRSGYHNCIYLSCTRRSRRQKLKRLLNSTLASDLENNPDACCLPSFLIPHLEIRLNATSEFNMVVSG